MSKKITVAVSGGLDPIHVGHIRLFKEAKELGDKLIVILNSDKFLKEKKGYYFMPFKERKEVLESIKYVDEVVPCFDKDDTVCNTLASLKPDIFANGGDRKEGNVPEKPICDKLGIKMVYNVGGKEKVQSSSWLTKRLVLNHKRNVK
jgi:glycerol-3-phosphate cytidylyltransferase